MVNLFLEINNNKIRFFLLQNQKGVYICNRLNKQKTTGEMAEWSNAPVLKTGEGHTSGGSNPSFSAKKNPNHLNIRFLGFSYACNCTIFVL